MNPFNRNWQKWSRDLGKNGWTFGSGG